ncbi:sigma-70 family RNA polymerase sigma factor [bacterium]|nr:sigma-70 family RNA polymerase sigma factor [bacterium]
MARLQEGQTDALDVLVARHQSSVYNFLFRFLRDPSTAESATAEAFFRVWKFAPSFRPYHAGSFRAWIFTIARNQAMSLLKKQQKRPASVQSIFVSDDLPQPEPEDRSEPSPEKAAFATLKSEVLGEEISRLPLRLREALLLGIQPQLGYEDIAKILGCTVSAVKARIHKARVRLRNAIK